MKKRMLLVCGMIFTASVFGINPAEDFQSAVKLYNGGKYAEAEGAFVKLGEQNTSPKSADDSLAYAAYSAGQQKNIDKAMEYAGKIKDKSSNTLCRMKLLEMQRKWDEIISISKDEDFDQYPDSLKYDSFLCRGNAYLRVKNAENAEKDFLAVLKNTIVSVDKAEIYQYLGSIYNDLAKDKLKAFEAYGEVVKIMSDPKPSLAKGMLCRALIARAKILASQGKGEEALPELEKLKELGLKDTTWSCALHDAYGEVYQSMGKDNEALESYRKAAAVPNAPDYFTKAANQKITELEKKVSK
jgi:tetratricopeptide (TPR) repeat protein